MGTTFVNRYIGEAGRRLGDRFSKHLRSVVKKADQSFAKHFCSPGHTTEGMHDGVTAQQQQEVDLLDS